MHRLPYRGGVRLNPFWRTPPPRTTCAALAGARCPAQFTSFCPAPSKHLGKPANGSPGREVQRRGAAGPACAQGSPVRCGCARCRQARPAAVVRARTRTSTRAQRCLRSAHTQLAQLPYPPAPPPPRPPFQHSRTVENCQPSNTTNMSRAFTSPPPRSPPRRPTEPARKARWYPKELQPPLLPPLFPPHRFTLRKHLPLQPLRQERPQALASLMDCPPSPATW
jgi:hypothetical protein